MENCSICNKKLVLNMATRQYYCSMCGAMKDMQNTGKTASKPKKKDCGCGRKKRKS